MRLRNTVGILVAATTGVAMVTPAAAQQAREVEKLLTTSSTALPIPFGFNEVVFSSDGHRLVAACNDGIRLVDTASGRVTVASETGARSVALSPDGQLMAILDLERRLRILDTATGAERHAFDHLEDLRRFSFLPNSTALVMHRGRWAQQAVVQCDLSSGKNVHAFLIGKARDIALARDGESVATAGQILRVWDREAGIARWATHIATDDPDLRFWEQRWRGATRSSGQKPAVECLAFSPNGNLLVIGGSFPNLVTKRFDGASNTLKVWDAVSGQQLATCTGHVYTVRALAFSPDSSVLASAGDDRRVRLWEPTSGTALATLRGHTTPIVALTFGSNGTEILSVSQDPNEQRGELRRWRLDLPLPTRQATAGSGDPPVPSPPPTAIDLAPPILPRVAAYLGVGGSPALHENHAYVAGGTVSVFRLPGPSRSDRVREIYATAWLPGGGSYGVLRVIDEALWVGRAYGLDIYSLATPDRPVRREQLPITAVCAIIPHDEHVYVLSENEGLVVVDAGDPLKPARVAVVPTGLVWNGCVVGTHLYLATVKLPRYVDSRTGISIFDISNPAEPTHAGFVPLQEGPYNLLGVNDDKLAVLASDSAQLYSLANPRQPAPLGKAVEAGGRAAVLVTINGVDHVLTAKNLLAVHDDGLSDAGPLVNGVNLDGYPLHGDARGAYAVIPTTYFAALVVTGEPSPREPGHEQAQHAPAMQSDEIDRTLVDLLSPKASLARAAERRLEAQRSTLAAC